MPVDYFALGLFIQAQSWVKSGMWPLGILLRNANTNYKHFKNDWDGPSFYSSNSQLKCLNFCDLNTTHELEIGWAVRVVKTGQLIQNFPSKPSDGQPSEGLLQTFFILKAITTSCLDLKFLDCPMLYPKVSN